MKGIWSYLNADENLLDEDMVDEYFKEDEIVNEKLDNQERMEIINQQILDLREQNMVHVPGQWKVPVENLWPSEDLYNQIKLIYEDNKDLFWTTEGLERTQSNMLFVMMKVLAQTGGLSQMVQIWETHFLLYDLYDRADEIEEKRKEYLKDIWGPSQVKNYFRRPTIFDEYIYTEIFPNPCQDNLTVDIKMNHPDAVRIVYKDEYGNFVVETPRLPSCFDGDFDDFMPEDDPDTDEDDILPTDRNILLLASVTYPTSLLFTWKTEEEKKEILQSDDINEMFVEKFKEQYIRLSALKIEIYDVNWKLLKATPSAELDWSIWEKKTSTNINVSDLSAWNYFINIIFRDHKEKKAQKIIKRNFIKI